MCFFSIRIDLRKMKHYLHLDFNNKSLSDLEKILLRIFPVKNSGLVRCLRRNYYHVSSTAVHLGPNNLKRMTKIKMKFWLQSLVDQIRYDILVTSSFELFAFVLHDEINPTSHIFKLSCLFLNLVFFRTNISSYV